ncbi:phosphoribosylamine--glycine ligase [Tersicoccus solisilvae]|uniref:phosphoribosylamine--glycine ligase n=1 Tax=Tersicoccus solisilvae TaxID=1882339 RepID=UPI00166327C7|nr:phosphoribosylamine--glycine ligase [Tersicoccus solisilvae]
MKVLVLGSGGREHALVRSLAEDPFVTALHAAPGNAGIAQEVPCHPVDAVDGDAVVALAAELGSELVVIGPEAPLVAGVGDALREAGIAVFGPSAAAARLEGSKAFAKEVMAAANVPTAMARVAATREEAAEALDAFGSPYVVKDDGLAAGKGVVVTEDRDAALAHAEDCFRAGGTVLIEEYLRGPEVSLFVLCDGRTGIPLSPAQDFKRIHDGDEGPNTGGMGAYTPLDWAPAGLVDEVMDRVATPVLAEMASRGTPFTGVLYCGLALTPRGIRVVEFNVRFGDPETQAVLARLKTPLGSLLLDAAKGRLDEDEQLHWRHESAVAVVLAAPGYPASPRTGGRVRGVRKAAAEPDVTVLHAGTGTDENGRVIATGGRVLAVVGRGDGLDAARERAYAGIERIRLDGGQYRHDIAAAAAAGRIEVPAAAARPPRTAPASNAGADPVTSTMGTTV